MESQEKKFSTTTYGLFNDSLCVHDDSLSVISHISQLASSCCKITYDNQYYKKLFTKGSGL